MPRTMDSLNGLEWCVAWKRYVCIMLPWLEFMDMSPAFLPVFAIVVIMVLPKVDPGPVFFWTYVLGLAILCMRLPLPGLVINIEAINVLFSVFLLASVSAMFCCEPLFSFFTVPEAEVSFVIRGCS